MFYITREPGSEFFKFGVSPDGSGFNNRPDNDGLLADSYIFACGNPKAVESSVRELMKERKALVLTGSPSNDNHACLGHSLENMTAAIRRVEQARIVDVTFNRAVGSAPRIAKNERAENDPLSLLQGSSPFDVAQYFIQILGDNRISFLVSNNELYTRAQNAWTKQPFPDMFISHKLATDVVSSLVAQIPRTADPFDRLVLEEAVETVKRYNADVVYAVKCLCLVVDETQWKENNLFSDPKSRRPSEDSSECTRWDQLVRDFVDDLLDTLDQKENGVSVDRDVAPLYTSLPMRIRKTLRKSDFKRVAAQHLRSLGLEPDVPAPAPPPGLPDKPAHRRRALVPIPQVNK